MGTNYYWSSHNKCPTCGATKDKLHIGKSSHGWAFALNVDPTNDLENLDDWLELLTIENSEITDEYGNTVPLKTFLRIVVNSNKEWVDRAEIGKGNCIGHGTGPWDYIIGEFS